MIGANFKIGLLILAVVLCHGVAGRGMFGHRGPFHRRQRARCQEYPSPLQAIEFQATHHNDMVQLTATLPGVKLSDLHVDIKDDDGNKGPVLSVLAARSPPFGCPSNKNHHQLSKSWVLPDYVSHDNADLRGNFDARTGRLELLLKRISPDNSTTKNDSHQAESHEPGHQNADDSWTYESDLEVLEDVDDEPLVVKKRGVSKGYIHRGSWQYY